MLLWVTDQWPQFVVHFIITQKPRIFAQYFLRSSSGAITFECAITKSNFRLELLDLVVVVVIMFHRFSIAIPLLFDTAPVYPISMDFTLCQRLSVASYFAFLEMDSNWRRYHFSYGLLISRLATISIHELKYVPGSCRTYFSGIIQNLRAQYL